MTELITDKAAAIEFVTANAMDDFFGRRCFPIVFLPETATLKQFHDVVFWGKGYTNLSEESTGDTVVHYFMLRVKPDYVDAMVDALLTAGGGVVCGDERGWEDF